MKRLRVAPGILACICFSLASYAAADEPGEPWELRLDRDGVQVYTSAVAGSPYDAVLSRTLVSELRLSALAAVILDAEACPRWADRCAESSVHELISDSEALVYTLNDLPFPVRDRDVLAHVKWTQDADSLAVTMHSEATTELLPENRGVTRLVDAQTTWDFTPLPNGDVEVINWAHIDPGSNLPAWITNMLLIDTPFETMKALVAEARTAPYVEAEVSFIREPR
ncbi:MAG: START domain-containing protein [Gammaproteobacteria bacterium]